MENILKEYTSPSLPGALSGYSTFKRELKKRYQNINDKELKDWMQTEETYTLHKPARKKFKRNRIIVKGINDTFQADLIDVSKLQEFNDSHKYLLTCIDVFSKYAWAIPILNKSSEKVLEGFQKIFSDGRIPNKIQTDQGNEFINKVLKKYLKNLKDIRLYVLNSEMKASIIERFNRTLKEKMWRFFTHKQTYRYIDILSDIIKSYNSTYHRSIRTSPNNVTKMNEEEVWRNLYGKKPDEITKESIRFKFNNGDYVRISKSKSIFDKGYTANWTREIFKIHQRIPRIPPVYKIIDTHPTKPDIIEGVFYEEQLQKINPPKDNTYLVEEIIKKRKNQKTKQEEALIKWIGYPEKFNTWEPVENITHVFNLNLDKKQDKSQSSIKERLEFSV